MLSYKIKSKLNDKLYESIIYFNDLLSNESDRGEITKDSKCWLCNNNIIGQIGEYEKDSGKYYIYFKCEKCKNGAELTVNKSNVKFIKNIPTNNINHVKSKNNISNPIPTENKSSQSDSVNTSLLNKNKSISPNKKSNNPLSKAIKKQNTPMSKTMKKRYSPNTTSPNKTTQNKRPKFISYKNQVLFHEPILGDPNSGNIHSTCCSNKCKKCHARLTGKATKLNENQVSLYWKCTKCDNKNDIVVNINELD